MRSPACPPPAAASLAPTTRRISRKQPTISTLQRVPDYRAALVLPCRELTVSCWRMPGFMRTGYVVPARPEWFRGPGQARARGCCAGRWLLAWLRPLIVRGRPSSVKTAARLSRRQTAPPGKMALRAGLDTGASASPGAETQRAGPMAAPARARAQPGQLRKDAPRSAIAGECRADHHQPHQPLTYRKGLVMRCLRARRLSRVPGCRQTAGHHPRYHHRQHPGDCRRADR